MPKKNPLNEIARIMAQPLDDAMRPSVQLPFEPSGGMPPIGAGGGANYEEVLHRLQGSMEGKGGTTLSPGLDRLFDRLAYGGGDSRHVFVFTEGEMQKDSSTERHAQPDMSVDAESVEYMVRLDHSGSTPDGRPMREGFWRSVDEPHLPEPHIDVDWADRDRFLSRLAELERQANTITFRGFSICRICGNRNGSATNSLGAWEWPSGYGHYLRDHGVRPSPGFEAFVNHAFVPVRRRT